VYAKGRRNSLLSFTFSIYLKGKNACPWKDPQSKLPVTYVEQVTTLLGIKNTWFLVLKAVILNTFFWRHF